MADGKVPKVAFARKLRRDMSNAERKLWSALRGHRFHALQFRRQAPCGPFIADFLCHAARLVIEIDGATHSTDAELARDRRRDAWFEDNGFSVLRVTNAAVYAEFDGVLELIRLRVEERLPPPQPSPASRERESDPGPNNEPRDVDR
ncbi:MAG: endonuclease domain-containing protein [Methylocystis sp.]